MTLRRSRRPPQRVLERLEQIKKLLPLDPHHPTRRQHRHRPPELLDPPTRPCHHAGQIIERTYVWFGGTRSSPTSEQTRRVNNIVDEMDEWREWLTDDGPIAGTVGRLEVDRDRWSALLAEVAVIGAIPYLDDTLGWFGHHYVCDAAVRLRRLGDPDKRSASLGRLLAAVANRADQMTRHTYLDAWRDVTDSELWESLHKSMADSFFNEFAGARGSAVDPALVQADLDRLNEALAPVKLYVDKRLAHHNPAHDPSLTYEEISHGIDTVGDLYRKYVRLVRRVGLPTGPPVDNTHWGEAFTVAWCPSGLPALI